MSKLVHEFSAPVTQRGASWTARIRGDQDAVGHWQGWIEFLPQDGGPALQTGRETTQSEYEHLRYWASGLSPAYLEMAFQRARPTESHEPSPPPPLPVPSYDPARIREGGEDSSVVRLQLETLDPSLPRRLMRSPEIRGGRVRRIPGGGILVYDGVEGEEGQPSRHTFLLQYGSENAAAVLANHLWSALHGEGGALFVDGAPVEIDSHLLNEALKSRLPAHR